MGDLQGVCAYAVTITYSTIDHYVNGHLVSSTPVPGSAYESSRTPLYCDDGYTNDFTGWVIIDCNADPTNSECPAQTLSTPWGTAHLTYCGSDEEAQKQSLSSAYDKASKDHNEWSTLRFHDADGNIYITDPMSSGQVGSITFNPPLANDGGNGLQLDGIDHVHWSWQDASGETGDFTINNWQDKGQDGTTDNYFSPADEDMAEQRGVPITVTLGNVMESFRWDPPPKNSNGTFNRQAPDSSLGQIGGGYTCM